MAQRWDRWHKGWGRGCRARKCQKGARTHQKRPGCVFSACDMSVGCHGHRGVLEKESGGKPGTRHVGRWWGCGQAHCRDMARKGSQPATRGTWTRGGQGTRSGGSAGTKAEGPVRVRNRRGVRARGSARLKSPQRWRNLSTRPRGPRGARGNGAGSSREGTPFGGCGAVNGAGDTLAGDSDGGAPGVMDGVKARASAGATGRDGGTEGAEDTSAWVLADGVGAERGNAGAMMVT